MYYLLFLFCLLTVASKPIYGVCEVGHQKVLVLGHSDYNVSKLAFVRRLLNDTRFDENFFAGDASTSFFALHSDDSGAWETHFDQHLVHATFVGAEACTVIMSTKGTDEMSLDELHILREMIYYINGGLIVVEFGYKASQTIVILEHSTFCWGAAVLDLGVSNHVLLCNDIKASEIPLFNNVKIVNAIQDVDNFRFEEVPVTNTWPTFFPSAMAAEAKKARPSRKTIQPSPRELYYKPVRRSPEAISDEPIVVHPGEDKKVLCKYRKSCYESGMRPVIESNLFALKSDTSDHDETVDSNDDIVDDVTDLKVRCKYRPSCYAESGIEMNETNKKKSQRVIASKREPLIDPKKKPKTLREIAKKAVEDVEDRDQHAEKHTKVTKIEQQFDKNEEKLAKKNRCKYRKTCYETDVIPELEETFTVPTLITLSTLSETVTKLVGFEIPSTSKDFDDQSESEQKVFCKYRKSCYGTGKLPEKLHQEHFVVKEVIEQHTVHLSKEARCKYRKSCYETGIVPDFNEDIQIVKEVQPSSLPTTLNDLKVHCKYRKSCYQTAALSEDGVSSVDSDGDGDSDSDAIDDDDNNDDINSDVDEKISEVDADDTNDDDDNNDANDEIKSSESDKSAEDDDDDETTQGNNEENDATEENENEIEDDNDEKDTDDNDNKAEKKQDPELSPSEAVDIIERTVKQVVTKIIEAEPASSKNSKSSHSEPLPLHVIEKIAEEVIAAKKAKTLESQKTKSSDVEETPEIVDEVVEPVPQKSKKSKKNKKFVSVESESEKPVPVQEPVKPTKTKSKKSKASAVDDEPIEAPIRQKRSKKSAKVIDEAETEPVEEAFERADQAMEEPVEEENSPSPVAPTTDDVKTKISAPIETIDNTETVVQKVDVTDLNSDTKNLCKYRKSCYESGELKQSKHHTWLEDAEEAVERAYVNARDEIQVLTADELRHRSEEQKKLACKFRKSCYETGILPPLEDWLYVKLEHKAEKLYHDIEDEIKIIEGDEHKHRAVERKKLKCKYRKSCYETGKLPPLEDWLFVKIEHQAEKLYHDVQDEIHIIERDEHKHRALERKKLNCKFRKSCYETGVLPPLEDWLYEKIEHKAEKLYHDIEDEIKIIEGDELRHRSEEQKKLACKFRKSCYETGILPPLEDWLYVKLEHKAEKLYHDIEDEIKIIEGDEHKHRALERKKLNCKYRKSCYETGVLPPLEDWLYQKIEHRAEDFYHNVQEEIEIVERDEHQHRAIEKKKLSCKYRNSCYKSGQIPVIEPLFGSPTPAKIETKQPSTENWSQKSDGEKKVDCRYRKSCYDTGILPSELFEPAVETVINRIHDNPKETVQQRCKYRKSCYNDADITKLKEDHTAKTSEKPRVIDEDTLVVKVPKETVQKTVKHKQAETKPAQNDEDEAEEKSEKVEEKPAKKQKKKQQAEKPKKSARKAPPPPPPPIVDDDDDDGEEQYKEIPREASPPPPVEQKSKSDIKDEVKQTPPTLPPPEPEFNLSELAKNTTVDIKVVCKYRHSCYATAARGELPPETLLRVKSSRCSLYRNSCRQKLGLPPVIRAPIGPNGRKLCRRKKPEEKV